jgi:hypothetical protein
MFNKLHDMGVSSSYVYMASIGSVALSIVMWMLRGESGQRAAIFVGLWPPTLMIMGKILEDKE